jgi:sugar lactone lactonase YvrE
LGGAIFNQLGTVNATSSAFTSNSASGGPGYGTSSGFGGAIFNLNGSVSLTDSTYSGNTALDSTSTPDGGAVVYNLSHNGGNTTAIQTSTAVLTVYGDKISTTNGDLKNNQANGTATVYNGISSINELTVYFSAGGTLNSIQVLTGGAPNLDFKLLSGGTCAIGTAYTAGESCNLSVVFTPLYAGLRSGAILLTNSSGAVLASKYISAIAQSPQITYSSTTSIGIGSGWNIPGSVAVDGAGNVYVVDSGNNRVVKIPFANTGYGSPVTIASGGNPNAVAVDGAGNVFYTNSTTVVELPFNGSSYGSPISISDQLSPGWADPTGIAVDGAGNLFVLDYGNAQVVEVPFNGTTYSPGIVIGPSSDFLFPTGLAIDSSDNVYVADGSINAILQLTYSSSGYGGPNYLGSGFVQVYGVAVDATGNVYAEDPAGGTVSRIPWTGSGWGGQTTVLAGLNDDDGIGLDGQGNIYITAGFSTVEKFTVTNPPSFNFSTPTPVGSIDTADGPQTVSIFNIGNQPLVFIAPASGSNPNYPANFPENTADGSLCNSAAQLAEGTSCDVSLNFAPLDIGTNTGSVVLTDNALNQTNATQSISLTGANNQQTQTITFTPPTSPVYYPGSPITLSATGGASGNPVTFSIVSGPGTLSGTNNDILNLTGVGTVVIAASQAGSASYTAAPQVIQSIVVDPPPAVLTSPTPGLTTKLGTTNVTFQWTTAAGATEYQLNLSAIAPGASDLFLYKGTATSATALTLPANNVTVYATLYSKINGVWYSNAYEYTESGTPTPAALTTPTPGLSTILGTTNVQFQWTTGTNVADYQLNLSAIAAGGSDLYTYKGAATTATVPTIPANGVKVYATLYSKINGVWQTPNSYVYTESGTPTPAALTSPTPGIGTTLGTSNVTFNWTAGIDVADYQLDLSAIAPGDSELYLYKGTALTATATTLPANGARLYARLYSKINGAWQYNDYVYTEGGTPTPAALTSPMPGLSTILGATNVVFQWTAGIAVTDYQLNLSAIAPGDSELYLYKGTALTATAPSLPANGVKVYARLYSKINGTWQYNDYQYTEQ